MRNKPIIFIAAVSLILFSSCVRSSVAPVETQDNQMQTISAYSDNAPIFIGAAEFEADVLFIDIRDASLTSYDISGLARAENLIVLALEGNQIDDISVLMGLNDLVSLSLRGNQINDISPLRGLDSLTWLHLGYNRIDDISALKNKTEMVDLFLFENQIKDISPLGELLNLERLDLRSNLIEDISALFELTNLSMLNISGNPVSVTQIEELKSALPNCIVTY